jgi:hypothetical protein
LFKDITISPKNYPDSVYSPGPPHLKRLCENQNKPSENLIFEKVIRQVYREKSIDF